MLKGVRSHKSQQVQQSKREDDVNISRQQESQEKLLRRSRQRELRIQLFTTRQWKQGAYIIRHNHHWFYVEVLKQNSFLLVCETGIVAH